MFKVYDKNNKRIRRGNYVRYNGETYKVSYAVPGKLILNDGHSYLTLTGRSKTCKDRFLNIEVVFDRDEADRNLRCA